MWKVWEQNLWGKLSPSNIACDWKVIHIFMNQYWGGPLPFWEKATICLRLSIANKPKVCFRWLIVRKTIDKVLGLIDTRTFLFGKKRSGSPLTYDYHAAWTSLSLWNRLKYDFINITMQKCICEICLTCLTNLRAAIANKALTMVSWSQEQTWLSNIH